MATGTVKWFNDAKGYGFIAPEDGGKDLFVHHSNIAGDGFKSLTEGAKVEYESREAADGRGDQRHASVRDTQSLRKNRRSSSTARSSKLCGTATSASP